MASKEPEWKKRCRKCRYSTLMHGCREQMIACYYIAIKEERRGCPGAECDKFTPRRRGRPKKEKNDESKRIPEVSC